ncbi:hypothetical protein [Chryseobacterium herbae]|uniref:Uncharacterized protein n=1 Tax=Chryseobacterium herbae TaxID=2976476 RepID=A0ABT2IVS3_9FLAO|nr:hypothetical protein [Chryseobacterium sp. pc1-10]MCT2562948.1 hypothetical protein [Chryseobacterium sp. pc1-10]
MKKILTLIALSQALFMSAQKKIESSTSQNTIGKNTKVSFDHLLKCSDYSYGEKYFLTADYGCIYNPKEKNTFGNLIIYLLPKKKLNLKDSEIDKEVDRINHLNIEKFKENFEIYVYLIPKEFLNYNATGDPVYYQNKIYKEKLFTYKGNQWELIDSMSIKNSSESQKEQEWREAFIEKQSDL